MKPKVVITHRVHDEVLEKLASECELITNQTTESLPRTELIKRAADADAMMVFMPDRVDHAFLEACPNLKVIGAALKGYDNFDVQACSSHGVWLTFVPDLLTVPTAELTIGLMIGLIRHFRSADLLVRSGNFKGWRPQFYGLGISGSTLGIIGMGAIGQAIATRLLPWNAKILYSDLTPLDPSDTIAHSLHFRTFDEVITHSDIVILALSLNEETFHRIDHEQLKKIKPGACIINPCRGSIVNEDAILASLLSGHLGGYAADVFEMEDWARGDRPAGIHPDLLNHPNTLFTAHIGSAVGQVRLAIEMRAADNILSVLRGAPPIDPANTLL